MSAKITAIVITACSKRKRLEPSPRLRAATLTGGSAAALAEQWVARLAEEPSTARAGELYQGRGFSEARRASACLGDKLFVLSAGLGLISADREVPAYALTVVSGEDNVLARHEPKSGASPGDWWRELTKRSNSLRLTELLEGSTDVVLVAAPSTYLGMISGELAALAPAQLRRVRLFTAGSSHGVAAGLQELIMPYDQRLEAVPQRSGTLSDFAQRALGHFADTILPVAPEGDIQTHAAAVRAALAGIEAPRRQHGVSMSDDGIVALIHAHWDRMNGKSAAMLQELRRSFGVACEQKRFKKLFATARLERTA